jgi:hypothetical protein
MRSGDGVAGASPRAISSTDTSIAGSHGDGSGQTAYVSTIRPSGSYRQLVECSTVSGSATVIPLSRRAAASGLSPRRGSVMACRYDQRLSVLTRSMSVSTETTCLPVTAKPYCQHYATA